MPILHEVSDVRPRLEQLGLSQEELEDVIRAAVGGRRDASVYDPAGSGGMLAYILGTRRLRAIYVPKGWEQTGTDNIPSIYNPATGMKITYQNADRAGDPARPPLAASKRGSGHVRAVESGQGELWPEIREREISRDNAASWYLFVYAVGDDVRAELSFPVAVEDDQFKGFHERIVLVQKGEWQGIDISSDDVALPEFDVDVTRKG